MTETIMFALTLLLIMAAWCWALKRSLLDRCRDHLFDIRDEARAWFLARGQLDSPVYLDLRRLLNAHITYTHQMNFTRLVMFAVQLRSMPEAEQSLRAYVDRHLVSVDEETNAFVRKVRENAAGTVARHTLTSSPILLGLVVILIVLLTPVMVGTHIIQGVRFSYRVVRQSVTESVDRLVPVSNRIVEELSLKYGMNRGVGADTAFFAATA